MPHGIVYDYKLFPKTTSINTLLTLVTDFSFLFGQLVVIALSVLDSRS